MCKTLAQKVCKASPCQLLASPFGTEPAKLVGRGMAFITDKEGLKAGLIIAQRSDVPHHNWYC
jgi:hypothetical protein